MKYKRPTPVRHSFLLPPDLADDLRDAAYCAGTSMTDFVLRAIAALIARRTASLPNTSPEAKRLIAKYLTTESPDTPETTLPF